MRIHYVIAIAGIGLTAFLASEHAVSHRDTAKPLFVSVEGSDEGRCLEAANACRTIAYALRQAGKGSQIRVGAGRFRIERSEDLFLLVDGAIEISGGYDSAQDFARRGDTLSTLTGVPEEYRAALRGRGFHVIADTKGAETPLATETGRLLAVQAKLQKGNQAGTCVNGRVDNLVCDQVDLLSHIPLNAVSARPAAGNDIWGFQDLNTGREYVVAGYNRGTAIFDVTDPTAPGEVGFVDGQNATWRDIKVYQSYDDAAARWRAYAYVTTDGTSDGLFVIDLSDLPHSIRRISYPSQFASAHNVYSSSTEFGTGLPLTDSPHLIIAGSGLNNGQYRAYDLENAATPQFVTGSGVPDFLTGTDSSYMHDAASLLITDTRKDTQCVNGAAYCELLLDFNEQKVAVWDITDITDPQHLNVSSSEYPQRGYVHSGWWSEDRQFMFVHDELDEQRSSLNTTLRVFSLADLTNPQQVGTWTGPTTAIDHNGFVRGNRYYMSNYERGLTILDITNPGSPELTGHLDTYPFGDDAGFFGAWGVYPYLPSGTLAISDINSGVYLAVDRSRDVAAGSLGFQSASFAATEGQTGQFSVLRNGNSAGAVSVDIEVVNATTNTSDYALLTSTLTWPDGDSSERTVDLAATADGASEALELLFLRLVNPTGGATLADQNTAHVYLADAGATSQIKTFSSDLEVAERGFGKAVLVLQRSGAATGAVSVDYSLTAGNATEGDDYSGATSGTVNWADGDADPKSLEFIINDDGINEDAEFFELTFSNPTGAVLSGTATSRITILNGTGVNLAPNAVVASGIVAAENSRVTLNGAQSNDPDGDTLAYEWSQTSGPAVILSTPATVTTEFTAPEVTSDTLLQFRLTVSDPAGLTDSATANVTVTNGNPPANSGSGGGGGAPAGLFVASVLLFVLRRAVIRKDLA